MEQNQEVEVEKFHQFESTMLSCRHVFSNGKVAHFINGVFRTNLEGEAEELKAEVKAKNPYLSYRGVVTADDFDPLARIKKQAVEEYKAKVAAQAKKDRDFGASGAAGNVANVASTAAAPGATPQTSVVAEGSEAPAPVAVAAPAVKVNVAVATAAPAKK